MKALWRRGSASATDLADDLKGRTGWTTATTKTLVNRLLNKGAVHFVKQGKAYLYFPAFDEAACQAAAADTFLRRVFDGSLSPLLAHFAATRKLTPAELAELEQLLCANRKKK